MKNINVLDVTLRDGGCVNNFNFGSKYMNKILASLERASINYIELGYLDDKKGSEIERTQYINEKVIYENFLKKKEKNIKYVVMMDYGKYDVDSLSDRKEYSIDGIRIAFHKKDWEKIIPLGKKIIEKGYELFIQPMLSMRYSDKEMITLINTINNELPEAKAFYIVDSFGEMRNNDVIRLMHLIDHNLNKNIMLGFHSHNNLQLSYANSMELLNFPTTRDLIIDASIMGMGKGAGNLNTELLLEHLNIYFDKKYNILPLLEVIDNVISVLHKENYWGYSVEYYLSSINKCTPSYARYFYNKQMLSIDQLSELLNMISDEKKISFDEKYAETIYLKYNTNKVFCDDDIIKEIKRTIKNKTVLLIAPGKTILKNKEKIKSFIGKENIITISLNNLEFNTDYLFITRKDFYRDIAKNKIVSKIIMPSNLGIINNNINVIDYEKWILKTNKIYDSSTVIIFNILKNLNVENVLLAGFDGFSINMNENYYDATLRNQITIEQAELRNNFYKKLFSDMKKYMNIEFITESMYE